MGHGTRTVPELAGVLAPVGVGVIIDVRRYPRSRRQPALERSALENSLPELGIDYEWWGESFGGRRSSRKGASRHPAWRNDSFRAYADHMESDEFKRALEHLKQRASEGPPPAVMCAETLWWRCHRRLIADALVAGGCPVVHLIDGRERPPHELHPAARLDAGGGLVYDVGGQGTLIQ